MKTLLAIFLSSAASSALASPVQDCLRAGAGAYALPSGEVVALNPSESGGIRWTHEDGRTGRLQTDPTGEVRRWRGWTTSVDTTDIDLTTCDEGRIRFEGQPAPRIDLHVQDTAIEVDGATLAARLVLPARGPGKAMSLVVEVQGSGRESHLDASHRQYLLPAHGIAVFIYDKRGTGRSTGEYTQDFHVLARDAAAAYRRASSLLGATAGHHGFVGSSQGGWVAPLAALQVPADFVVVNYGLAYSALREDLEQVLLGVRTAGWKDPLILSKAEEVAEAAGRVKSRKGDEDIRHLMRLRDAYRHEPWWKDLQGEFTGAVANAPKVELARLVKSPGAGTSWDYDPMPTLRSLKARQLWLIAGRDMDAPPAETLRRLGVLQCEGKPLTVATFPEADHGLRLFEIVEGVRQDVRYARGSQRAIIDWIRGAELAPRPREAFVVEDHANKRCTTARTARP